MLVHVKSKPLATPASLPGAYGKGIAPIVARRRDIRHAYFRTKPQGGAGIAAYLSAMRSSSPSAENVFPDQAAPLPQESLAPSRRPSVAPGVARRKAFRFTSAPLHRSRWGRELPVFNVWISHAGKRKKILATVIVGSAFRKAIGDDAQLYLLRFAEVQQALHPEAIVQMLEVVSLDAMEAAVERLFADIRTGGAIVFLCESIPARTRLLRYLGLPAIEPLV